MFDLIGLGYQVAATGDKSLAAIQFFKDLLITYQSTHRTESEQVLECVQVFFKKNDESLSLTTTQTPRDNMKLLVTLRPALSELIEGILEIEDIPGNTLIAVEILRQDVAEFYRMWEIRNIGWNRVLKFSLSLSLSLFTIFLCLFIISP